MAESWQLKIRRAKCHLKDVTTRMNTVINPGRRALPVKKDHRADGKWYYSLDLGLTADEFLPVVIGEFLFNLRSALDHIACATANPRSQFPIYGEDIWRQGTNRRETQRLERERIRWNQWTEGMKPDVLTVVKFAQPYRALQRGTDPRYEALAMLNDIQNADKHRELAIIAVGAGNAVSSIPDEDAFDFRGATGVNGMLRDGAVFLVFHKEVDVEFIGEPRIAMTGGASGDYWSLPQTLDDVMLEVIAIIGAIERAM